MLKNLYIENIAVIEKTSIDFTGGMNVLTGETGAGKSIIIDSINAILGNRTSRDLIRTGAESAFVSAEFTDISDEAVSILEEYGYEAEEDLSVMIQRELSLSGKGRCRIGGRPAPVSVLRSIGEKLIDIHGQHASYELMSPERHISYIDKLGALDSELEAYRAVYREYVSLRGELSRMVDDESERIRKADLLRYQIDELEKADLWVGEYEELSERKKLIENAERISQGLELANSYLAGSEDSDGAVALLEMASDSLSDISDCIPGAAEVLTRLNNAIYEIEDCREELVSMSDQADTGLDDINQVEERLDLIYSLGKKYGVTIEEMLSYLENARKELEKLEGFEENRDVLYARCNEAKEKASEIAGAISEKRKKISREFESSVKKEMTYLDMPNVELVVDIATCPLDSNGIDKIEILISTNPGEPPKPVARIASGGELSRMMLAIKNVLSDKDPVDTLIFDEVDTGISGSAAQKVGLKLREVSSSRQVMCVTHLAQIAALADSHFKIEKSVVDGKTYTQVSRLDHEGRKNELARIIGGVEITQATLDYAEEMLGQK